MGANNNPQANLTEFLDHFNKATEAGIGVVNTLNEPTIPVDENLPLEHYVEQAKQAAPAKQPAITVGKPAVSTVSISQPVAAFSEQPQKFGFYSGSGDPPPGYRISESCANCEYFCGAPSSGHCYKYDFPCASNYLCDSYERCEPMQFYSHTENSYKFAYDVIAADAQSLSSYAETLQKTLRAKLIDKGINLADLSSNLYVYDQESAEAAYKLSGAITDPKAVKAFARLYSQYHPEAAAELLNAAPDTQPEPGKTPSYLPLFQFAQSISSSSAEAYEQYEKLYAQKFGDVSECYVLAQPPLTNDMSGTITEPAYAGDTLATEDDYLIRLRKVAENRVSTLAAKHNKSFTQEDVEAELKRIQQARPKLNTSL